MLLDTIEKNKVAMGATTYMVNFDGVLVKEFDARDTHDWHFVANLFCGICDVDASKGVW